MGKELGSGRSEETRLEPGQNVMADIRDTRQKVLKRAWHEFREL